jgi:hypothetical protein
METESRSLSWFETLPQKIIRGRPCHSKRLRFATLPKIQNIERYGFCSLQTFGICENGEYLITDIYNKSISLCHPIKGTLVFKPMIENGRIRLHAVFNKKKSIIVAAVYTHSMTTLDTKHYLHIWHTDTLEPPKIIMTDGMIDTFVLTDDGTRVIAICPQKDANMYIKVWNLNTEQCITIIHYHMEIKLNSIATVSHYNKMALSQDEQTLVTVGDDKLIRVWDLATNNCKRIFYAHKKLIMKIAISNDGTKVASADLDGIMYVWDTDTGIISSGCRGVDTHHIITLTSMGRTYSIADNFYTKSIKFSFDGTQVVFTCREPTNGCYIIGLLNISASTVKSIEVIKSPINAIDFCYCGNFWNRSRQTSSNVGLIKTILHIILASKRNQDLPHLPIEMWERVFGFLPVESIISAMAEGYSFLYHV